MKIVKVYKWVGNPRMFFVFIKSREAYITSKNLK